MNFSKMKYSDYRLILLMMALTGLAVSCAFLPEPDKFVLDRRTNSPIQCTILSNTDSVEKRNDNEMMIYNGGICALKREDITQSHFMCSLNVNSGKGIKFYFRSDPKKFRDDKGIMLDFNERGSFIFEDGKHVQTVDTIRLQKNFPILLQIKQDGSKYLILADCDTVYRGITSLTATEYMIIKPNNCDALLYGFHLDHIFDYDKYNRQQKEDRDQLLDKLKNN